MKIVMVAILREVVDLADIILLPFVNFAIRTTAMDAPP